MSAARLTIDDMEFYHPVEVTAGGDILPTAGVYAPECIWNGWGAGRHVEPGTEWVLVDGFSGQYRYTGPIMHPSEYLGGAMARHMLATPGVYVLVACIDIDTDDVEGWALAYMEEVTA